MIKSLRGMRDILDDEAKVYEYIIKTCSKIAKNYGFSQIHTPLLEEVSLFRRSVGASSDIAQKEMYEFTDKGGHEICLRPEGTAGVVRTFIEKKMDKAGGVKKFFYYGPMFRYERPQKGRLRQFNQFGIEVFNENNVKEDVAVILMLKQILDELGIKTRILLNSLGCPKCMPTYREKLLSFLDKEEGICEDCKRRKETNPIRVLDCKADSCQEIYKNAPLILDNLCDDCKNDFEELKTQLKNFNVEFELDPKLVRGLDYYSKTAFEFVSDDIGAKSSIAGGGRYDRLVEMLGGKPSYGIGFAMGLDRLEELVKMPKPKREGIYLAALFDEAVNKIFELGIKKRVKEKIFVDYKAKSLKAHLKQADLKGVLWFACIGENELHKNTIWLKNLESKEEKEISIKEFLEQSYE